ncbi:MAG: COP23 domain-containing protein [Oscillatoria princeps RMCB-10]|jgi:hypothetical protein|nr:COP23 domain-containing protein [Oscillatoria princeps RMCB-10]
MKLRSLPHILIAASIALGAVTISQPTYGEGTSFFCGACDGVPITFARTAKGYISVIRWVSEHFSNSGYTPQKRCQEVSARFQTYYNSGTLNYITAGRMNGQPVVCVADRAGGRCTGLLFTLKPGTDANSTVRQLFDIRTRGAGPLEEVYARIYINMNDYLNTQPAVKAERSRQENASPYCSQAGTFPNINQPGLQYMDESW